MHYDNQANLIDFIVRHKTYQEMDINELTIELNKEQQLMNKLQKEGKDFRKPAKKRALIRNAIEHLANNGDATAFEILRLRGDLAEYNRKYEGALEQIRLLKKGAGINKRKKERAIHELENQKQHIKDVVKEFNSPKATLGSLLQVLRDTYGDDVAFNLYEKAKTPQ